MNFMSIVKHRSVNIRITKNCGKIFKLNKLNSKMKSESEYSISSEFFESQVNEMIRRTKSCHSLKNKRNQILICISGKRYRIISEIAKELQWKITNDSNLWNIF